MGSFQEYMNELKNQIKKGVIPVAYKGLIEYVMGLRTYFIKKYPDYFISGIYSGYMDMTYFSFSPEYLKKLKLKIAIVFVYDKFRFEIWLAGYNKQVQLKYWRLIKDSGWNKYHLVPSTKNVDSIVECTLVNNPDFSDLSALTEEIENSSINFINDVEEFLSKN